MRSEPSLILRLRVESRVKRRPQPRIYLLHHSVVLLPPLLLQLLLLLLMLLLLQLMRRRWLLPQSCNRSALQLCIDRNMLRTPPRLRELLLRRTEWEGRWIARSRDRAHHM